VAISAASMGKVSFIEEPTVREVEDLGEQETLSIFPYQETPQNKSWASNLPLKQGLYDPELEKDACGVGFAA
jgi:glutamate synthase (NADPH/NADH)